MDSKVEKVLVNWHEHFQDEENQYAEYEPSDIEYFVGCMLYNYFAFSKAHHNVKTMDLSYDFLSSCGDTLYENNKQLLESLVFENEEKKLEFLQAYIQEVKAKYSQEECYLLARLEFHVKTMAERYEKKVDVKYIDFENPLLKK